MRQIFVFDLRIAALLGILLVAVVLLICDTDDHIWFVVTKFAGIALIYAYGKLFAKWEPVIFKKDDERET